MRVSAKNLTYVVCDACNAQVFARSDRSDEKLRAMLLAADAAPAAPAPQPTAKAAVSEAVTEAVKPAEKPAWGALSWMG